MSGTITAISVQKKNPNRLTIELDGEFGFGLDRLVGAWLRVGDELSDEQIQTLKQKDTMEACYLAAIRFLSYRLRSRYELEVQLGRKGFAREQIELVMARLIDERLVDDTRFAESWTESRQVFRPRSHRLMSLEMRQKGIGEEIISNVLEKSPEDEQLAYNAGNKALRRWQGLDKESFQKKCADFLMRRGFSYEIIRKTLPRLWSAMQEMN
jgi:regulatory protein